MVDNKSIGSILAVVSGCAIWNIEIELERYIRLGLMGLLFFTAVGSYCLLFSTLFITIFSLFRPLEILEDSAVIADAVVLAAIAVPVTAAAIKIFLSRDFPV